METIEGLFTGLGWKYLITVVVLFAAFVDLVSKKFEKEAIVMKLLNWFKSIIFFNKLILKELVDINKRLSKVEIEVSYNGGSKTAVDAIKILERNQDKMLSKIDKVIHQQFITENIRMSVMDIDSIATFKTCKYGELVYANRAFCKLFEIDDVKTILGMGFLKILDLKQIESLRQQGLLNGDEQQPFDGVINYVKYISKAPISCNVLTTLIYDENEEVLSTLGTVTPI